MRIETFRVERGSWPPAAGEILIDRTSLDLLRLEVGQVVVVQAPNGRPTPLRISGVVYYPALAPSFQEQKAYGFISAASLPVLGAPVALDALKIQVAERPGLAIPSRNRDIARMNNIQPGAVVDLKGVPECNRLAWDGDRLILGAAVSLARAHPQEKPDGRTGSGTAVHRREPALLPPGGVYPR